MTYVIRPPKNRRFPSPVAKVGLGQFAQAGINVEDLAAKLQDEGAKSFVKSWNELLAVIASKSTALREAA